MLSQRFLIPVLALLAAVIPAAATTTTYTNPATFNTATQSLFFTQIDFNTATFGSGGYTDASGTIFGDILNNQSNLAVSSTCANTCAPDGQLKDNGTNGFTITLPNTVYAFAFYVSSSGNVTIAFQGHNDSFSSTTLTSPTTPTFFGAVTDAPVSSFTITGSGNIIDDFEISSGAAPTAEAATFILIGSGLILLRLVGRRRAAAAA